jgi:hypothetical protein
MIRRINPSDECDLRIMEVLEISSFKLSGNDPTEYKEVIKYIAEFGKVFLGYDMALPGGEIPDDLASIVGNKVTKGGEEIPASFIELITLDKSMEFYYTNKNNPYFKNSPFMVSKKEADRIYNFIRKLGFNDSDIVDHHGIGVHKDYQGKGKGKELLNFAMADLMVTGKVVQCNIDIAKKVEEGIEDIFNDGSFSIHFKSGFVIVDVLYPPVYENSIIYAATVRIPEIKFKETDIKLLNISKMRKNPKQLIDEVHKLTSSGYVGVGYDKESVMHFKKLK